MTFSANIHRWYLYCKGDTPRASVRGLIVASGNGGPQAEALNMAIASLCMDGSDVPNAYACAISGTEARRQILAATYLLIIPAGAYFVRCDCYTDPAQGLVEGTVRAANFANGIAQIGSVYDEDAALTALGLTRPVVSFPGS